MSPSDPAQAPCRQTQRRRQDAGGRLDSVISGGPFRPLPFGDCWVVLVAVGFNCWHGSGIQVAVGIRNLSWQGHKERGCERCLRTGPVQRSGPGRAGPPGLMLPAGCGRRSAAALAAALGEGAERRRELERRTARSRALLRQWGSEEEEQPQPEAGSGGAHDSQPSPRELEDLELLNKALEKALKVRRSILKAPSGGQGAVRGKSAGEGPAAKGAREQQAPVPAGALPEGTELKAGSRQPAPSKKPSPYQLRAPYRTDPDVKRLQRRAPARCASQGPKTAGKSCLEGVAGKQGEGPRRAMSASDRGPCAPADPQDTPGLARPFLDEQQGLSAGDSAGAPAGGSSSLAAGKQLLGAGKRSCGGLGGSSRTEEPAAAGPAGRSSSPRAVPLQGQGCQLQLPLPYRKAYARNSRAWQRCCLSQSSVDAAAARKHFAERVQSTFCSMPAFSPAEIEEQVKALQEVPFLLSHYMEAEPEDHPTLPGEYESLLTMEALLATASQCLHKLQLLQAAVEAQGKLCPGCCGAMGSCSPACAPAKGQLCGPADVLALPLLFYSSAQELRDLSALKLQVAKLQQEVALQKVMMLELLPALESRQGPEASAAQLYRALYSQLCPGGRGFPVLVRDELAD
ncbi:tubulin epsilon and delta complex protein 2 [Melanerpes formicivorus]|uniref:tubulin epsilon and delta complex protein 2 n=1 Tax=Melanerpes formicivorus TaxID=211600 RepID=UPI00358E1108